MISEKEKKDRILQCNYRKTWDNIAQMHTRQNGRLGWGRFGNSVVYKLYRMFIDKYNLKLISLIEKRLDHSIELSVLKTDLWNEAIESSKGNLLETVKKKSNITFFGTDISFFLCITAKKNVGKKIGIICANIGFLPFKDSSLDFIFDLSTIDHIPVKDVGPVIREYARIIKKDGFLLLIFNHDFQPLMPFIRLSRIITRETWVRSLLDNTYFPNKIWIRNLMCSSNFNIVEESTRFVLIPRYHMIIAQKNGNIHSPYT